MKSAVVVSAMSGTTNRLVEWCRDAAMLHDAREYDTVVASGEQVTSGLLAIALQAMGVTARSWQGWQLPILTSDAHASARILDIDGGELIRRFKERKEVAVIAGFQGLHKRDRPDHHAGPRRLRHLGGRHRRRHPRRPLRHLHRRRRRLHHRPARGAAGAAARQDRVRGDAGTGLPGRQGAAGALGRARHGAQGAHLRALELRPARGHRPPRDAAGNADMRRGGHHGSSRSSPASPSARTKPRSRSAASRTSRGSPPAFSGRWPTPTSMWT